MGGPHYHAPSHVHPSVHMPPPIIPRQLTEGCRVSVLLTSTTTTRDVALAPDGREIWCRCPAANPPAEEKWPEKPKPRKMEIQKPPFRVKRRGDQLVARGDSFFRRYREKIEEYLRFFTHAGQTRFPIFAWGNLQKLSRFRPRMGLMLTLTYSQSNSGSDSSYSFFFNF